MLPLAFAPLIDDIFGAPEGRRSKDRVEDHATAGSSTLGPKDWIEVEPCKGDAGTLRRPYRAVSLHFNPKGFGRLAAFALGFAVSRFQR
jgi:hypothetical protein